MFLVLRTDYHWIEVCDTREEADALGESLFQQIDDSDYILIYELSERPSTRPEGKTVECRQVNLIP